MAIIGLIGIIVALVLFLVLVYYGWSSYWVAPICAIIVAVTNQLNPVDAFTDLYQNGLVDVFLTLFSAIFLGAIFGKVFTDTGMASSIAQTFIKRFIPKQAGNNQVRAALLCILVFGGLCTLGGIDGYVLTFTLFPICMIVAEVVDIPRRFVPAMVCLNVGFIFCPGAPQIYNIVASAAVNSVTAENGIVVNATSGLIPGIVATAIVSVCAFFTLSHMVIKAKAKGETFDYGPVQRFEEGERKLPNFWLSIIPLVVVFILFAIVHTDVSVALAAGIVVCLLLGFSFIQKKDEFKLPCSRGKAVIASLNQGANNFPNAIVTVTTPAALAAVITATGAFGMVVGFFAGIQVHPIVLLIMAVCIIVAITSSPPAALMIALPMVLGIVFSQGGFVNPAAVMRVGAIAAATFETLPFNGLIVLTIGLARTSHRESYKPMFLMSVVYTFIGTVVAGLLFILFPNLA